MNRLEWALNEIRNRLAGVLAAGFAEEMGLPPGNMWEPGATRKIAEDLARLKDDKVVEAMWRASLGLRP